MREERLSPRDATRKSMEEITGALIGIAMVLSAVFLPMAFFGGSTGVIYRQFSVTIVSSMVLSVFVALMLTPALCATLLKPRATGHAATARLVLRAGSTRVRPATANATSARRVGCSASAAAAMVVCTARIVAVMALLFMRLPTGFLPAGGPGHDWSRSSRCPPARRRSARSRSRSRSSSTTSTTRRTTSTRSSPSPASASPAAARTPAWRSSSLKDWDERHGEDQQRRRRSPAARPGCFSSIRDAQVFALAAAAGAWARPVERLRLPARRTRGGLGHDALMAARDQLLGAARAEPALARCGRTASTTRRSCKIDIDQAKAGALGLVAGRHQRNADAAWGGSYVNDFIDRGRVKRVFMQGDAPFRMAPEDLERWYVRAASGEMAPFSAFATRRWNYGAAQLDRYNGVPALEHPGTGRARRQLRRRDGRDGAARRRAAAGRRARGAALSYQERLAGGQTPMLYAHLAARRVPVPRGAVRKLVGAVLGAAGDAARHRRRGARRDVARARRTTSTSRSGCSPRSVSRRRTRS